MRLLGALGLAALLAACQLPLPAGNNVALLYGVTTYDELAPAADGMTITPNLGFPKLDVEALAPLLSRDSGGIFKVTARTDQAATKAQIIADVQAAAATLDASSVFLFYYGGHGAQGNAVGTTTLDGHAYILPYGSYTWHPTSDVDENLVLTEDELKALLTSLPTKKVIVILDACFSGGFISGSGQDGTPLDSQAYYAALWQAFLAGKAPEAGEDLSQWLSAVAGSTHLAAQTSWKKAVGAGSGFESHEAQLLMAAGALEESYDAFDPEIRHGAFSYFLLQSKEHGDFDGNGLVTVSEAYRYAFNGIQTRWNGIWGAVGMNSFALTQLTFLPHLSSGPMDFVLFVRN